MQTSLPFIDIIVFAIIAVFLIYRLKNILGAKTGFDPSSSEERQVLKKTPNNVVEFSKKPNIEIPKRLSDKLLTLKSLDNNFDIDEFITGANIFFKMVINSFVSGKLEDIREYIKPSIYKDFENSLNERIKEGEKLIIDIKEIKSTNIKQIKIFKNNVKIQVLFETLQIKALKDKDDKFIDGDLHTDIKVSDLWTFERNFSSGNKNWTLIETDTP